MLKTDHITLPQRAVDHLVILHLQVESCDGFEAQVDKASSLWDSKKKSNIGQNAFNEIEDCLRSISIGEGICNYCEQSENGDIEHIRPKSFFPLHAFKCDNYIYACKQCNTGSKAAKMYIFNPHGSATPELLKYGADKKPNQPENQDICFIDPRSEDPMDLMELSLKYYLFYPKHGVRDANRATSKAEKTLEILQLNDRDTLIQYRRMAYGAFKRLLKEYVATMEANTHAELDNAIAGDPSINHDADLENERSRILDCTKKDLLNQPHLTVFKEMQRQVGTLSPNTQALFHKSGALNW
jgi:hypothetical protein